MFSELIATVKRQHAKNLPYVIYRKPNEDVVRAILQSDTQVHYTADFIETGFVFAPFDSNAPAIFFSSGARLNAKYNAKPHSKSSTSNALKEDASLKEFHINLVKKGIDQIYQGAFKKVVLSRVVVTPCDTSPINIFQTLLDTYSSAFCYLWHHPNVGTWLGATPEILLKSENKKFTTMSLAGTKKYVENEDPSWGNKELEEQQLVTDYIVNALEGKVSNLNTSNRESVRAGNLWHLRTKLTGAMENGTLSDIINVLHPTPAVCGMPRQGTQDFILKNENYDREYYTGFLGELNFKEEKYRSRSGRNQENRAYRSILTTTTLFVNLRCMQLKQSKAHVYIGGGVTQESEPEKEWQETVVKSKTILGVIKDH